MIVNVHRAVKHLTLNALGANNTSSVNVIANHLSNLLSLDSSLSFTIYTYRSSPLERALRLLPFTQPVKYIYFPSFFRFLPFRFLIEQLFLPLLIDNGSILLCFNGYCLFFCSRPQIILCHNPYPLYLKQTNHINLSEFHWRILFLLFKLTVKQACSKKLLAFNSTHIKNLFDFYFSFPEKFESFLLYNSLAKKEIANNYIGSISRYRTKQIFLSISPFSSYKQTHLIFEAFYQFASINHSAELIHVGRPLDIPYYQSIIADIPLSLRNRISIFTDFLPDITMENIFRDAFSYISMSKCESFGLPAIEAQCFGVPSIVLTGTAAEEICGSGALIVQESSSVSLCYAMRMLAADPDLHSRLSHNALANSSRYTSPDNSQALLDAVNSMLS